MNIPIVLEIQKYSLPETTVVDTRIQTRLCLQTQQIPTATEVQTTEIHTIDMPDFTSVDAILVRKKRCMKCTRNIPFGPIMICVTCLTFLSFILMDTFKKI